MIEFINAKKCYCNKIIIDNINLVINDGDFILLIGKNGSGKSTILKLIAGVINIDKKMIYKNLYNAYLPEKFSLPRNLYVKEFILFLEETFNIDLSYYINYLVIPNKKIKELSKGNLQKLGIITMISSKLNTILLDEPTEGMDNELKKKYLFLIKDLHKKGKTIIISTHNPKDYISLNPRKIYLNEGKIYEDIKDI